VNEAYLVAPVVSTALLVAEHYFPWGKVLGHALPRPAAYAMGTLSLVLPVTFYFLSSPVIQVLWLTILAGGMATIGCYVLDAAIEAKHHKERADRLEELHRDENER
jgi:hypothetical protein